MTELEAYRALNWPPEGTIQSFILPATGDQGTEYVAQRCQFGCGSISRTEEFVLSSCPLCGGVMTRVYPI
jgi:hypothetical protein